MITRLCLKSLPSTRRPFSCTLEKPAGSPREPNCLCSLTAHRDLCLIKSNSVCPAWRSTEELPLPSSSFCGAVQSELGGMHRCYLLVQGRRHFSSQAQPLLQEPEHPCSAELQHRQAASFLPGGLTLRSNFCSILRNNMTSIHS